MEWILEILKNSVELGSIYALVVLAVYFSSRVIKFDDLSVEGSFSIGGALTAVALLQGVHCVLALPLALIAGCCVGLITGLLHTKLSMNALMSGIVVTTGLFSVALKIAGPNVALMQQATLFDLVQHPLSTVVILMLIAGSALLAMHWLLKTEVGCMFRALGSNQQMLVNLGKRVDVYKITGLMLANALSALAGCLFVQHMRFYSITGCIGIFVIALAGITIGEALFKRGLLGLLVGSLVYQGIIAVTIELQVDPTWNKLIAAALIVLLVCIRKHQSHQITMR